MNRIDKLWDECTGPQAMEEQLGALIEKAFDLGRASSGKDSPFKASVLDRAWKLGRKHRPNQFAMETKNAINTPHEKRTPRQQGLAWKAAKAAKQIEQ